MKKQGVKAMLKKFFKNYEFQIVATGIIVGVFFLGVVVGMYGKSAPSLEVIEREQYRQEQTEEVAEEVVEDVAEAGPDIEEEQPEENIEMTVTATAYCPCAKCCGKSDGITATGTKATAGRTIAVDPSVIPYGTEVVIDGHTYIAEDCGGAVKGNRIDIFFNSHEEARQFGVQTLNVVLREEQKQ